MVGSIEFWGLLLVLLAVFNFKGLPGAWTARTLYHYSTGLRSSGRKAASVHSHASHTGPPAKKPGLPAPYHRLFEADILRDRVPLAEIDINLHKSNSTYFTDLDISRIRLMAQVIAPAWPMDDMLIAYLGRDSLPKKEKLKGRAGLILGATYTSFHKEMKPFVAYQVESKILGWDSHWIYVGSWFVSRHAPGKKPKQVFASSLSKYIIKKGRITVRPALFLAEAGWIPPPPDDNAAADGTATATWEEVEKKRLQGMEVVGAWAGTDKRLLDSYEGCL